MPFAMFEVVTSSSIFDEPRFSKPDLDTINYTGFELQEQEHWKLSLLLLLGEKESFSKLKIVDNFFCLRANQN